MAIMLRVTIAEAALTLGLPEEEIADRITSGTLVACQEPAFKDHVWINAGTKASPKRRSRKSAKTVKAEIPPDIPEETSQPFEIRTSLADELPVTEQRETLTGQLDQAPDSVVMLMKDLEMREAEITQLKAELDAARQEVQTQSRKTSKRQTEAPTAATPAPGPSSFRRPKKRVDATARPKPAPISERASLETLFEHCNQQTEAPTRTKWNFWYGIKPDVLRLIALCDVRIGKFIARTCSRFSHPLLS